MKINFEKMSTEQRNKNSMNIDSLSTSEILKVINTEDKLVPMAVEREIEYIEIVVDEVVKAFKSGGRLFYIGAGTSGRLGILDASECPPTYGTPPEMVQGIIAGGNKAILKAVENAEDNLELAIKDLKEREFNSKDILVGIAASGRTPYVISALEYANSIGAFTASITCNERSPMSKVSKCSITPVVGAEVVTGSSRMKAGTAQKLVLNMITTASMVKLGKVYENLMVDVEATNEKLVQRQVKIVVEATGASNVEAKEALKLANKSCKLAIFKILSGLDIKDAKRILDEKNGYIRDALSLVK